MKKIIHTQNAPAPIGPYSQAVMAGPYLFCSGQIALNAAGAPASEDVVEQAELVMKNVEALLKAASMDFTNVVKSTIFLTNMADFAKVNEVYGKYFKSDFPARSTIQVAGLPKAVKVEVEVIAYSQK